MSDNLEIEHEHEPEREESMHGYDLVDVLKDLDFGSCILIFSLMV